MTLDTILDSDGTTRVLRANGEQVAAIRPAHTVHGRWWVKHGRWWVNMEEGYPFDAMPMHSLEAAKYLVLASVMEHDALAEADDR